MKFMYERVKILIENDIENDKRNFNEDNINNKL